MAKRQVRRQATQTELMTLDAAVNTLVERLGEPVQAEAQVNGRTLRVAVGGNGTIWVEGYERGYRSHVSTQSAAWALNMSRYDRLWTVTTH